MRWAAAGGEHAVALHEQLHLTHAEPLAANTQKERARVLRRVSWMTQLAALFEVRRECAAGFFTERDDALFVALAEHARAAALEIDAVQVEPGQLAHAQAR